PSGSSIASMAELGALRDKHSGIFDTGFGRAFDSPSYTGSRTTPIPGGTGSPRIWGSGEPDDQSGSPFQVNSEFGGSYLESDPGSPTTCAAPNVLSGWCGC